MGLPGCMFVCLITCVFYLIYLWPPLVGAMYLIFSEPFPRFRVKMLTHFEDFLEL